MTMTASGSTGFTFPDNSTQATAAKVGMVNRIINGAMMIDQRWGGAAVSAASGTNSYLVDRWAFYSNYSTKFNFGQNQNVTPSAATGQKYCLDFNNIGGSYTPSGSDYFITRHAIEGYNVADLLWGTSSAKTVTLSFWVYAGVTGTLGGSIQNSDQTRSYPFTYTVSSSNTWEYKTVTIPGCTDGTWNTTTSAGLVILFSLGNGSALLGTANTWASTNYNGPTGQVNVCATSGVQFALTGVQLEKGSVATPFEYRPYGQELALCQRYCFQLNGADSNTANRYGLGFAQSSTKAYCLVQHPVPMRTKASITATASTINVSNTSVGTTLTAVAAQSVTSDVNHTCFDCTVASGLTANAPYYFEANGASSVIIFSAEL